MWNIILGVILVCTTEETTKLFHCKGLDWWPNDTTACFIYPWEILGKAEFLILCESKFAVLKIAEKLGV